MVLTPAELAQITGWRGRLARWVESVPVQRFIIAVIIINAITLGMETSADLRAAIGPILFTIDKIALAIFVVELAIKLLAFGARFFRNAWNVFDLLVVTIALVPASGQLSVLRALRILRVLRLVSAVPRLRFVVEALLAAVPGIAAIAGLMGLIFYVFAVIATGVFGQDFPDWFGTLGRSLYSLFQIMTLESWSMGIVRPVMQEFPWAWAFFIPFILIATFTMLNLFIAIIVNAMQGLHEAEADQALDVMRTVTHDETEALQSQLSSIQSDIAGLRLEIATWAGSVVQKTKD